MNDLDRIKLGLGYIMCLLSIMALVQPGSVDWWPLSALKNIVAAIVMFYGCVLVLQVTIKRFK